MTQTGRKNANDIQEADQGYSVVEDSKEIKPACKGVNTSNNPTTVVTVNLNALSPSKSSDIKPETVDPKTSPSLNTKAAVSTIPSFEITSSAKSPLGEEKASKRSCLSRDSTKEEDDVIFEEVILVLKNPLANAVAARVDVQLLCAQQQNKFHAQPPENVHQDEGPEDVLDSMPVYPDKRNDSLMSINARSNKSSFSQQTFL